MTRPKIGILLGRADEHDAIGPALELLEGWGAEIEIAVAPAATAPSRAARFLFELERRGARMVVATRGADAALPEAAAARSSLPVFGWSPEVARPGAPPAPAPAAVAELPSGDPIAAAWVLARVLCVSEPAIRARVAQTRADTIRDLRGETERLAREHPGSTFWNEDTAAEDAATGTAGGSGAGAGVGLAGGSGAAGAPPSGVAAGGVRILPPPSARPRTPAPHLQQMASNILAEMTMSRGDERDDSEQAAPPGTPAAPAATASSASGVASRSDSKVELRSPLDEAPDIPAERPARETPEPREEPRSVARLRRDPDDPFASPEPAAAQLPARRTAEPPARVEPREPPARVGGGRPPYIGRVRVPPDVLPVDLVEKAVACMLAGGIVAIPTDTVYGLLIDAASPVAAERLYELKDRPANKSIAIFIDSTRRLTPLVEPPPPEARRLFEAFWPGPLTVVLAKRAGILEGIASGPTIGIRIPDHTVPLTLAQEARRPLACTSANPSGRPEAMSADEIEDYFGRGVDMILDAGRLPESRPSTVIDASRRPWRIVREGAIDRDRLAAVAGDMFSE